MKLSIILPSRNEELLIRDTLESFYGYLKKKHYDFEIYELK